MLAQALQHWVHRGDALESPSVSNFSVTQLLIWHEAAMDTQLLKPEYSLSYLEVFLLLLPYQLLNTQPVTSCLSIYNANTLGDHRFHLYNVEHSGIHYRPETVVKYKQQ